MKMGVYDFKAVKIAVTVCWSLYTLRITVSLPYRDCRRGNGNHGDGDSGGSA